MSLQDDIEIRPARQEDLSELNDLYNHYLQTTHVTFDLEPVSMDQRRRWFSRFSETGPRRLLVAVASGAVLGFTASREFRERPAYQTSVETSVYCHPEATGRGIGSAMYRRLFEELAGEDLHRAYAGVALPNDASMALHRKLGFRDIGTFTEVGRKFGRYWDVLWLERAL